jgi:hypothetical protein
MVATPDPLEQPCSPALPTFARPTSLDHGSTMEITSTLPDVHLDEAQAPESPITPEKENHSNGSTEGRPPMSSPVRLIGINYFPPSPVDVQTTSRAQAPDPTPWESGAASPLSEDYVVVGLPAFPPKPCVLFSRCLSSTLAPPSHTPLYSILCSVQLTVSSAALGSQDVGACRFHRTVLDRRDAIRCTIRHLWDGLGFIILEKSSASNAIIRGERLCSSHLFIPWSLRAG